MGKKELENDKYQKVCNIWTKEDGDFMKKQGPIENYNFPWGSNRHSLDLSLKERYRI